MTTELVQIKRQFEALHNKYQTVFTQSQSSTNRRSFATSTGKSWYGIMYTIEIFSDGSRNPEEIRDDILAHTGTVPSIHDNGTHYVVTHKITLETLEAVQKYPDVLEITGEYSGGAA